MTSLKVLDSFIVGENYGMDSLPSLNFTGYLNIQFKKWRSDAVVEAQRATLMNNQKLTHLELMFGSMEVTPDLVLIDKMLMCLQLPPNLKHIFFQEYKGFEMPRRWLDGVSNLVAIDIMECHNCRVLPHLSRLPHLKTLFLARLYELEYVEDEDDIRVGGGKCGFGAHNVYFPSLEVLLLSGLRSLKGWTRPSMDDHGETRQLSFPRLWRLEVFQCPKLMSMSLAPKLESFRANRKVFELYLMSIDDQEAFSSSSSSTTFFTSLKELDITGIEDGPASLSISSRFFRLQNLKINDHQELTSLMIESSKSIRHLVVKGCKNISLGNLYVLETLIIHGVSDDLEEKLPQLIACVPMLQILGLERFRNLEQLPEEIGNLSLLRELKIGNCLKMAKLPQSLLSLTSLQKLHIRACPDLKKRYEKPNGQDCHLLQHISNVEFLL